MTSLHFHGSLDSSFSVGTNNLIKNGAKLVTKTSDILKNYPELMMRKMKNIDKKIIKEEYKNIYEVLLFDNFLSVDEIIVKTGEATRNVITKLTLMEMENLIEQKIGNGYRKKV